MVKMLAEEVKSERRAGGVRSRERETGFGGRRRRARGGRGQITDTDGKGRRGRRGHRIFYSDAEMTQNDDVRVLSKRKTAFGGGGTLHKGGEEAGDRRGTITRRGGR